ncbi:hypothetical protein GJ698_14850 [Pseudoduganella sp. FT26W]|uniref:Lipoprotein n=1 Tax=Duganella aquatilis TaxID=2666082 RepID=A0A844D9D6_9BURK|nr:hypothetical protein [Duganella aquatilis]MRW85362.1 hypothetical protein [Duganella aquatilis]
MQRQLTGVLLMAACVAASAEDLLVSARLESVTLTPSGVGACGKNPTGSYPNADGTTRVVVSNACGCQESKVKVERVYQGSEARPGDVLTLQSTLGEWCSATLPMDHSLFLLKKGQSWSWSRLTENDGQVYFDPQRLGWRQGEKLAPLSALPQMLARQDPRHE